ncbi:MAG: hypothetical protein AVDCRST_MAG85-3049, partial [uncultured Solirubrobacteraceae bacterium]
EGASRHPRLVPRARRRRAHRAACVRRRARRPLGASVRADDGVRLRGPVPRGAQGGARPVRRHQARRRAPARPGGRARRRAARDDHRRRRQAERPPAPGLRVGDGERGRVPEARQHARGHRRQRLQRRGPAVRVRGLRRGVREHRADRGAARRARPARAGEAARAAADRQGLEPAGGSVRVRSVHRRV